MKHKTITTDKSTLLVVELPEGAKPHNSHCDAILYTLPDGYVETEYPVESDGSWEWKLLGRLPDITEDQAVRAVDESIHSGLYAHYVKEVNPPNVYRYRSSRDSLASLLTSHEVYFENPLGEDPKITNGEYDDNGFGDIDKRQFKEDLKSWQEAQSKVWDKERTCLFIQVD